MSQTEPLRSERAARDALRGELRVPLSLRHGGAVSAPVRYEQVGSGKTLLIVAGGISAGRHAVSSDAYPDAGWWEAQARSFDPARVALLAIDWLGADGGIDLPIDPADQAQALAALLDHLGIARVHGFIGASYGGMVALHFAALHPTRCGAILAFCASASAHPYSSACRSLQRRALALGQASGDAAAGVALARAMAMLTYRSASEFEQRFAALPAIEQGEVRIAADDYLDAHGARHASRMHATAYRRLSESIDLHRIDPARVQVPATFSAADSDSLVPAADVEALARAIPDARFRPVHSLFGHDAFLKEEGQVAAIIAEFLDSQEKQA